MKERPVTRKMAEYYVYIMSNWSHTLYTGVTNDLERRVYEHKKGLVTGFASRYAIDKLVYCESSPDVGAAIAREKQIKGWLRKKKIALIESVNPEWRNLSEEKDPPSDKGGLAMTNRNSR